jgi:hypothetical protein
MGVTLHTLHTVWMLWPHEDVLELHGALDDFTYEENPAAFTALVEGARSKVGPENVRVINVEVDWAQVCAAFEIPKIEGTVAAPEADDG